MTDNPFVTNGYAGPGMSQEGSLSINITYPLPVPSSLPLKVCLKKTLSRTMVTNTLYTTNSSNSGQKGYKNDGESMMSHFARSSSLIFSIA